MSKVYQDNFNNSLSNNSDNEFTKKLRALKKYCPQAYKFVIFRFKDTYLNVENGEYSINLPTSKEFKFVYGQIKLIYRVKNKGIKFIDLEPEAIIKRRNTGIIESIAIGITNAVAPLLNIKNVDYSKEHIKEEIADVMVMLKQFQLYYDIPTEDIKAIMKNKVDRQLERIEYEPKHGKEE